MNIQMNESPIDRTLRTGLSIISAIIAYFWLWGVASFAFWALAAVLA